ncbi:sulfite exporter TauE/SafE family protein [Natronospirillum operosum]|uniref:Probable membrane transporter protein n=1 Tax=Natronospirillum operosum TaxID=2759953 RepID=A0A4Z0WBQ6_9GAMM|nr:sulfite exporter TauE/SafE family protein [Natronospirillum operosum]TGG93353.1 sulfite exporter TauE/SafE family protein [Natronospirillum operosum]
MSFIREPMPELSPLLLLLIGLIFVLAGMIKGLAGFGMPLIAIPALTLLTGAPVTLAMGWAIVSLVLTNLAQAFTARAHAREALRVWPLLVGLFGALAISVPMLARMDPGSLSMVVGAMILLVVASQLLRPWQISQRWQTPVLGVAGVISGTVGGLTSFFGFPAIQALIATGISSGGFIFTVSIMFFVGTAIIGVALTTYGLMGPADLLLSAACLPPALLGLKMGQAVRERVSVPTFQRILKIMLVATGTSMIVNGLF